MLGGSGLYRTKPENLNGEFIINYGTSTYNSNNLKDAIAQADHLMGQQKDKMHKAMDVMAGRDASSEYLPMVNRRLKLQHNYAAGVRGRLDPHGLSVSAGDTAPTPRRDSAHLHLSMN